MKFFSLGSKTPRQTQRTGSH